MLRHLFYSGPSFSSLLADYARRGRIDEKAASKARDAIDIDADARTVWKVVSDVASWPVFNPIVRDVWLESVVAVDAKARLKLNGFPVELTFAVVEPERELSWVGTALWTRAVDQLSIERTGEHTSRLHLNESLAGVFVPLMTSSRRLHEQHLASLQSFKIAAEHMAPA